MIIPTVIGTRNSGILLVCMIIMLAVMPLAKAGVVDTKHNLSSTGTGPNSIDTTGSVCVFCHTPHGADTSASVPLWNRVLSAPGTFTTYDSLGTTSLDGEVAAVGSVSIACLSCHDGTQAMNVMINAPGSDGYNPAGATFAGTWTGPAATATPAGSLNYSTASIVNIGADLTNDHPIGIQYGGGGLTSALPAGTTNDADFVAPNYAIIGGQTVWWLDTAGGTTSREKADLQLYTRNDLGSSEPFVECASCHNPHTSDNPTFLRIDNTASAVCLACHIK